MKDIREPETGRDDIDRIVDALLEDPNRAGDVKDLLRMKMRAPDVVSIVTPRVAMPMNDDSEDFWDNVPV